MSNLYLVVKYHKLLISKYCVENKQLQNIKKSKGKSSSQFPARHGENEAPVRSSRKGPLILGLTPLFRRRFFRDCPIPLGVSRGGMQTKIDCCNLRLI